MTQVYCGSPRDATSLARELIQMGVDAVAFARIGNSDEHAVWVPDRDVDTVRRFMALSNRSGAA